MSMPSMIQIPLNLARLLMAEREDFSNPDNYDAAQSVARTFLRMLVDSRSEASAKINTAQHFAGRPVQP